MKLMPLILPLCLLAPILRATEDALELIPLPLDTRQVEIKVVEVPFVIGMSMPESGFQALNRAYVPPAVSHNEQDDINMVSVAGIKVTPTYRDDGSFGIEVDYAGVEQEHQTEELMTALVECIYRIAARDDGYRLKLKLLNLDKDSDLHAVFQRLIKTHEAASKVK